MFNLFNPAKATLGRKDHICGDIKASGELVVQGFVEGDIEVDQLRVGRKGHVDGDIIAETVRIAGYVKGSVHARYVVIEATAHVEGVLHYEHLSVAPTADLCAHIKPDPMIARLHHPMPVRDFLYS